MEFPDYLKEFMEIFFDCSINYRCRVIIPMVNASFRLEDVNSKEDMIVKIMENLSRPIGKGHFSNKKRDEVLKRVNEYMGTSFTREDMYHPIYTFCGNGVNTKRTLEFVKSGYDFSILKQKGD